MSWDKTEYIEIAKCACGKGTVERIVSIEEDDWNRIRSEIISEKICCDECKEKYHIYHYIRHYPCPSWEGDGIIDKTFLVPNHLQIPSLLEEKYFGFSVDEQIVAKYSLEEILAAKADMIQNRYSTRLERQSSKEIVALYNKKHKKKSLPPIIQLLNTIESQYLQYEWTPRRLEEYRNEEKIKIKKNREAILNAINQSFELDFRRKQNEQV